MGSGPISWIYHWGVVGRSEIPDFCITDLLLVTAYVHATNAEHGTRLIFDLLEERGEWLRTLAKVFWSIRTLVAAQKCILRKNQPSLIDMPQSVVWTVLRYYPVTTCETGFWRRTRKPVYLGEKLWQPVKQFFWKKHKIRLSHEKLWNKKLWKQMPWNKRCEYNELGPRKQIVRPLYRHTASGASLRRRTARKLNNTAQGFLLPQSLRRGTGWLTAKTIYKISWYQVVIKVVNISHFVLISS